MVHQVLSAMWSLVQNRGFVGRPHSWYTRSCPQCGVSWGQLSQTLTSGPFSAAVCPGGKSRALCQLLRDRQLHGPWVSTGCWCRRSCPQCGLWPRSIVRGCAPMMGAAVVVRKAESGPASCFRGCVVGRVVEVEFVGVCGRTRRPVLDFRPTVGVIVAACAGPATSVAPSWQVASRRVISPRGFPGCAPMMGAAVVVRKAE